MIDSDKVCPSTEIGSDLYGMLHWQQLEHANDEYNTRDGLGRSRDYCLQMIIDCQIQLSFWTGLIALNCIKSN